MNELRDQLIRHEGLRLKVYKDSLGIETIGVGRNIQDVGLSKEEALYLLDNDIATANKALLAAFPWVTGLDSVRQDALTNMTFNMGIGRLRNFAMMMSAMQRGDFEEAAKQALDSKWAVQVGRRANELAEQIRTGAYQ